MVKEAKIEPPIQTEYFLSGKAMILTFLEGGDGGGDFLLSAIHGSTARHRNITIQVLTNINIILHDKASIKGKEHSSGETLNLLLRMWFRIFSMPS